jgi:hypothetical protein
MEIINKEFQAAYACFWKLPKTNLLFVTAYFVSTALST